MTSAVLPYCNEPYFGEREVYMKKLTSLNHERFKYRENPNPTSDPISNPNPSRKNHGYSTNLNCQRDAAPVVSVSDDTLSMVNPGTGDDIDVCYESAYGRYISFKTSGSTRRELKVLKKRLISELEQVKHLRARIDSGQLSPRSGHPGSQFSASCENPISLQQLNLPQQTNKYHHHLSPNFSSPKNGKKKANKKPKKLSGNKRCISAVSNGNPKPPMGNSSMGDLLTSMKNRCSVILGQLMRMKFAWVFNKPVDAAKLGLLDYHRIIRNPMDLGTVKNKLRKGLYLLPLDFADDVRLTFNNAMMYNPEGQDVHTFAKEMLSRFNSLFNDSYKKFEDEQRRIIATKQAPQLLQQQSQTLSMEKISTPPLPADSRNAKLMNPAKLSKPKARDPNKREMSFEEKSKLGFYLQNFPQENMGEVLDIVRKRNVKMVQDGDEIELDIELMDNETLWELDRFVSNSHKLINKSMRVEQADEINNNNNKMHLDSNEMSKKAETGEEDIDIGEEMPLNYFPPVEIEKDAAVNASSGSSSSSGTSSSGSSSSSSSDSGSGSESDDAGSKQAIKS